MSATVIDLQRRYNIFPKQLPTGAWEVIDLETFDHDPESELHLYGRGRDINEATIDLLEKIAEVVARPRYRTEVVAYSRFEPPITRRVRIPDPDLDD